MLAERTEDAESCFSIPDHYYIVYSELETPANLKDLAVINDSIWTRKLSVTVGVCCKTYDNPIGKIFVSM